MQYKKDQNNCKLTLGQADHPALVPGAYLRLDNKQEWFINQSNNYYLVTKYTISVSIKLYEGYQLSSCIKDSPIKYLLLKRYGDYKSALLY